MSHFKLSDSYQNRKVRSDIYSKGGSVNGTLSVRGDINQNGSLNITGDIKLNGNSIGTNNQKYISLLKDNTPNEKTIFPYIDVTGLAGKDQNGNEITSDKWLGGTIALDGCLYCAPYNANRILKINTEYNTATSLNITNNYTGDKNNTSKWAGGACSFNNKIYFAPYNAEQILVLDVNTQTTYTLDYQKSKRTDSSGGVTLDPLDWSGQYKGACVDLSENIIFMPFAAMQMMKLNPTDDSITYYGLEDFSNNSIYYNRSSKQILYTSPAASGGALSSNGNIYLGLRGGNSGLRKNLYLNYTDSVNETIGFIDLSNAKIDGSDNVSGDFRSELCEGIVADTEGRYVYFVRGDLHIYGSGPYQDKLIRLDTADPSHNIELIQEPPGLPTGYSAYAGGVLAPDGKIYCGSDNNLKAVLVIDTFDPSNSYFFRVGINGGDYKELYDNFGMLLGCNGYVYSVPHDGSRIKIIHQITPSPKTSGFMVSRYYNKY